MVLNVHHIPSRIKTAFPDNRNRFFISARTILYVRFDPNTLDAPVGQIRDEGKNRPGGGQARKLNKLPPSTIPSLARAALEDPYIDLSQGIRAPVDDLSRFIDIVPLHVSRKVQSYRLASELDLKFSWKDIPFDSRIVRAMMVLHYEGTVSADNFSRGITEASTGAQVATGFIIPATRPNLRFMGLVDEIHDEHSDQGDDVTLKARDLTALLIDAKIPPTIPRRIKAGTTIRDAIRTLLRGDGTTQNPGLPIAEWIRGPFMRPFTLVPPKLDPKFYTKNAQRAQERHIADASGGDAATHMNPSSADQQESYWDVITDICVSHGLVPIIELDKLYLQEPRTFFSGTPEDDNGTPTFPTDYRKDIGDTTHQVRRMVWGENVASLKVNRKLARIKAPHVQIVANDPNAKDASKRRITVTHPPIVQPTSVDPSGANSTIQVFTVKLPKQIKDVSLLKKIAESVYEGLARGEVGVCIETDNPASYSEHPSFDPNDDPDLLSLVAGDPVEILVTPTERRTGVLYSINELSLLAAKSVGLAQITGTDPSFTSATEFLVSRGWKRADAVQMVKILAAANLPTVFRVNTVTFTFDLEGASFGVSMDLRNYIRVRADPNDVGQTRGFGRVLPGSQIARIA